MTELTPRETIAMVQQIYNLLQLLTKTETLAGIVLTNQSYDQVKREFGDAAVPYSPSDLVLDPQMNDTFVVDGLLVMRGTQLQ